jgi:hypothetical protein
MKNTLLLLSLIFLVDFAFGQGDAPPMLQGQNQTSKTVAPVIKVPASQATKVTGGALIETGNKNILANPSFEHSTFNTGWTCTGITPIAETTVIPPGSGKQGMLLAASSSTFECYQDVTASTYATSVQFLAAIRLKTAATGTTLKVCSRQAGTTSTTNCVYALQSSVLQVQNVFNLLKVPFIGGDTSNGISISGTSVTGNIYLDDAFVGPADLKVDLPKISTGTATYTPTTNCNWTNSGVSALTSTVDTDCPTPIVSGIASAPATKVPGIVLPAGTGPVIDFDISGYFRGDRATATNVGCAYDLYDGTNSYPLAFELVGGASGNQAISDARLGTRVVLPTALSSAKTYEVRIFSNSATSICQIGNDGSLSGTGFQIAATSYGGNTAVYSSTNKDTDWAACSFSSLSWQGMGTVTPSLYCKRHGSDLLMRGYVLAGTSTASTIQMLLPTWNGSQLTIKNSSYTPTQQLGGTAIINSNTANSTREVTIFIKPALTYLTMGYIYDAGTQNPFTEVVGTTLFGGGSAISFETIRIPIEGWENSNVIVGSFDGLEKCVDSYECTDTFSAKVSAAGVVSDENIEWITGNASVTSTSQYALTFKTGLFTVAPTCVATTFSSSSYMNIEEAVAITTSGGSWLTTITNTTVVSATPWRIVCQKAGADYLGKTAKAVASDANIRSIGATGVDIQSVYFGSGATCTSVCTGTCTICNQVGSKITSVVWAATGNYRLNGIDGKKYNCSANGAATPYLAGYQDRASSTTTYAQVAFGTSTTSTDVANAQVTCIGVP